MQNKKEEERIFFERVVFISITIYFIGIIAAGLWEIITDFL